MRLCARNCLIEFTLLTLLKILCAFVMIISRFVQCKLNKNTNLKWPLKNKHEQICRPTVKKTYTFKIVCLHKEIGTVFSVCICSCTNDVVLVLQILARHFPVLHFQSPLQRISHRIARISRVASGPAGGSGRPPSDQLRPWYYSTVYHSIGHIAGVLTCSRGSPAARRQQWWRQERQRKQPL